MEHCKIWFGTPIAIKCSAAALKAELIEGFMTMIPFTFNFSIQSVTTLRLSLKV